jgi:Tol biopolymer transport system component
MTGQTLRRWIIRALILVAALVGAGFVLREPVTCFFFVRNPPDDLILYSLRGSVRIMSLDGAGRCPITSRNEEQRVYAPIGSPDGRRIAFTVEDRRESKVWMEIVNVDGSERSRITPPELEVISLAWFFSPINSGLQMWSPDGERLVFSARPSGSSALRGALYLWSSAEGAQPIPNSDGAQVGFWAPDGEHLLLITDSPLHTGATRNHVSLEIMRVDGSERRLLADDAMYWELQPLIQWLPDGNIVYLNDRSPASRRSDVIVIDPQTGETQGRIAFNRYWLRSFSPSPDGAQFAITAWDYGHNRPTSGGGGDDVLLVIDRGAASEADARVLRRDADNIPSSQVFGWSPDGANVYYRKDTALQRLTLAGGEELTLDDGIDFTFWRRGGR